MSDALRSVAILKANIDENHDYIDIFIPFIATLLKKNNVECFDIKKVHSDFEKEFGLHIPYHPFLSIVKRCSKRKLLFKKDQLFLVNREIVEKYQFGDISIKKQREIDSFINNFINYTKEIFNFSLSNESAYSTIISYLNSHTTEIIYSSKREIILPEYEATQKEKYLLNEFIINIYKNNQTLYDVIVEIAVGYLYASSIFFLKPEKPRKNYKNLKCFLDTRLILRLVGLEGKERKLVYEEFIENLKEKNIKLRIFDHTIDEINGILDDCEKWVENPRYNPKYAGPALKHFVENRYTKSDIVLFKAQLESKLTNYGIRKITGEYSLGFVKDLIDEQKLYDEIVSVYKNHSDSFEEWTKKEIIFRDVKSISTIRRLRKNQQIRNLYECDAIFVTTNKGLAYATYIFFKTEGASNNHINECVTDIFLGTFMWLDSPLKFTEMHHKRIIADSIAAIEPNPALIEKYIVELEKLKDNNKIDEDEYFFLKKHKLPLRLLEEKTFGDPNEFYDKLPEEIYHELKEKIIAEEKNKSIGELEAKDAQIKRLGLELENTKSEVSKTGKSFKKVTSYAEKISKRRTKIIAIFISTIILACGLIPVIPKINIATWLSVVLVLIFTTLSIFNLIFGLTIKGFMLNIKSKIYNKILNDMEIKNIRGT